MKKILVLICCAVCVVFALSACGNDTAGKFYDTKLMARGEDGIFKDDVAVVNNQYRELIKAVANNVKTVTVNNNNYTLNYEKTSEYTDNEINIYISQDEKVICKYNSNDKLRSLYVNGFNDNVLSLITAENEYTSWCTAMLNKLVGNIPSEYVYSCETGVIISGDDFAQQEVYPYFYKADKNDEQISFYRFAYTRHINGMPTSDEYSVYIRPQGGILKVELSPELFNDNISVNIDNEKIASSVEHFGKQNTDKKYSLRSYDIKDAYLGYIDGKLNYICSVEFVFTLDSNEITTLESLAVCLE